MNFIKSIFKREKRKETKFDIICAVVSCWLLSVGTALVLDSQYTIQIGIKAILWQTAAATLVIFLLTRKWWIPIIYVGILVPLFIIFISASGDLTSFFKSVYGFFKWWLGDMSIESRWYSELGYYLIHTCMNIIVSVMYFAIARITKRAWISVLVALGFLVANYAFGYTGFHALTIPFFVVGIFPLIAGEKFQNIKVPDFKDMFGLLGKKSLMVIVSTLITVLIAATSLFVTSNMQGSVRTRFCSDIMADFQTISNTYTNEQKKVKMSLFDIGLAMNSTFTGGNLYDIKSKTLATTDLTQPTRIKVTAFDTFDGKNWIDTFEKTYRINGFLWKDEQKEFLSSRLLGDESFMESLDAVAPQIKVNITLKTKTNFLPTTGQVVKFTERTKTKNPILFDSRGRLLSYFKHGKGYTYSIETRVVDPSAEVTESMMNALLGDFAYVEDPNYDKNSEFYKHYTKSVYEEFPGVATMALKKLTGDEYNEYQIANRIAEYFSKGEYYYVKKPDFFTKGDNILEKLFSTKRGNCMYYSTAMVALAREAGIPSRLAVGYVTVPNKNGKTQDINASSPYAWVECYIPNFGWVSFDPSPLNKQSLNRTQAQSGGDGDNNDYNVDVQKEKEKEVAGTHLKWSTAFTKALPTLIAIAVVILFVLIIIIHTVTSQSRYKLNRVRKRFKTTEKQAKFYYADILRQYSWLGFKLKRGETIRENTDRVCATLQEKYAETVGKSITSFEALYYGEETPTDSQIEEIARARQLLENVLKDRNNWFTYTIKRRLLLPTFNFKR